MAYRETSKSCTVYQSWKYQQTGGSAGGNKLCTGSKSCTVTQSWAWDGDMWVTNGSATNNSSATMPYSDSDGYSGTLNRTTVSGSPSAPSGSGSYFGETRNTSTSGTANYSATLTKTDTRTYGWATNGSQSSDATSSTYFDDGSYAGWLYLYSVVGSPPTPTQTGSIGSTDTTSASGTAYYSGDIPAKPVSPPSTPANFRVSSKTKESVNLAWDSVTTNNYNVELYLAGTSTLVTSDYSIPNSQLTKFFTGLFSDTQYQAKLYASNSGGNSSPTFVTFTTDPEVPNPPSSPTNLRVTSKNTESINLAWDSVTGATKYAVETYLKGTSTLVNSDYSITGTTKFVSGLFSGTEYTFKLWAVNSGGNSTAVFISDKTSEPVPTRPSNWTWSTLVSGSSTYELGGVLRADVVSNTEWNDFCKRINEFRQFKNLLDYSFSTVVSKASITNSIYEEARLAISAMTTVPASVSTGETGVNSKINALSIALNSIA
jgi:hypothetical protein